MSTLSAPKCGQNLTLIGWKSTSYPALQERVAASGWAVAPKADGPRSKMEHVKSWNQISGRFGGRIYVAERFKHAVRRDIWTGGRNKSARIWVVWVGQKSAAVTAVGSLPGRLNSTCRMKYWGDFNFTFSFKTKIEICFFFFFYNLFYLSWQYSCLGPLHKLQQVATLKTTSCQPAD